MALKYLLSSLKNFFHNLFNKLEHSISIKEKCHKLNRNFKKQATVMNYILNIFTSIQHFYEWITLKLTIFNHATILLIFKMLPEYFFFLEFSSATYAKHAKKSRKKRQITLSDEWCDSEELEKDDGWGVC